MDIFGVEKLILDTGNMKYLKLFEEHSDKQSVVSFLLDFGMFITMNLSKVENESKDDQSKIELSKMLSELRKPLINGKNFSEITSDINSTISNPKMLSGLFSQIRDLLTYIEPRIQKFVKDSDRKNIWLDKIINFKERYKNIVS
jgi:vacuolar-type H+-ATPase subunit I/STV1